MMIATDCPKLLYADLTIDHVYVNEGRPNLNVNEGGPFFISLIL